MKLLDLEIYNVRGIKELKLKPDGENLLVWGPNGSGKSAVVDAVDFLLTGRISRLMGEGTGGVTLKAHGPHIDRKPKDASVKALIAVEGVKEAIPLERNMSAPTKLICRPEHESRIAPVLELALKGQHVLSRREILNYVAAEAGKRASEVQALLNLSPLEDIRKSLGKVANSAKTDEISAGTFQSSARVVIQTTLGVSHFDLEVVTELTNKLRATLGGEALIEVSSASLKKDLTAPSGAAQPGRINPQLLSRMQGVILRNLDGSQKSVAAPDNELRQGLEHVRANESALREISKMQLFEQGLRLIPDDGACPLCGMPWKPGELRKHLESHLSDATAASEGLEKIRSLAEGMAAISTAMQTSVAQFATAAAQMGLESEARLLTDWSDKLGTLSQAMADPVAKYPSAVGGHDEVAALFAPTDARTLCAKILSEAEKQVPAPSPEQAAWDTLTRLEENWRQYEAARSRYRAAQTRKEIAVTFEESFESARNSVLGSLFKSIETRFSQLYRSIHEEDEPEFESALRLEGAGLTMEVDFYKRGKFPPIALHSEGHQDTMGLCLYLALSERLTRGVFHLTILDDVVMSVDAGHRRKICELLASQFPGRQFLITTHDGTWARQLTTTAVVPRKNSVEFTRWSLETGPLLGSAVVDADFWKKIEVAVDGADVPVAAARLRRGAEQFFEQACDNLCATIRYRSDGRWELADFAGGAIGAYKKYLRGAKAAAQSWRDTAKISELAEIESIAAQVIQRSQVEQWAINENVHYNRWSEFQPADFRPVCEAFRDLFGLFECAVCGGMVFLAMQGIDPTGLRCKCGKINWNLLKKAVSD